MQLKRTLLSGVLALFAMSTVGCNLAIQKTFAMQDGSALNLFFQTLDDPPIDVESGKLTLGGGVVMTINVSMDLFDYLDGTMDGDITVDDVLFTGTGLNFVHVLEFPPICIALASESGGAFAYALLAQTATFDVVVNTAARFIEPNPLFGDPLIPFPFHLVADIPLPLLDALGLFLGTGQMTVTQHIDTIFPFGAFPYPIHLVGDLTLKTQDTFPTNPLIEQCLVRLAGT